MTLGSVSDFVILKKVKELIRSKKKKKKKKGKKRSMPQLPWVKNPKRYAIFFFRKKKGYADVENLVYFIFRPLCFFLPLHGQTFFIFLTTKKISKIVKKCGKKLMRSNPSFKSYVRGKLRLSFFFLA